MRIRLSAVAIMVVVLAACGLQNESRQILNLPTKTADAGDVTVKATPQRIGKDDAVFMLTFVSSSTRLSFDVAAAAQLTVDGVTWKPATWDSVKQGEGSLEGRLEFRSAGAAHDRAVLRIDGLASPVTFTWSF